MWTVADLEEIWFSANCSTSRCVVAASGGGLCQWSRGISEGQEIQHFGHDFHQIWTCAWLCSIHPGRLGWWFDCGGAPKISQHLLRHRRKQSHCMYPTAGRCEADCRGSSRQGPVICNLTMNSARRVKICSMICHIYVRITNLLWQKFANCNRKDKTMPDNRLQHLDLYIVGLWKIMNVECWMICSYIIYFHITVLKDWLGFVKAQGICSIDLVQETTCWSLALAWILGLWSQIFGISMCPRYKLRVVGLEKEVEWHWMSTGRSGESSQEMKRQLLHFSKGGLRRWYRCTSWNTNSCTSHR